jgi:aryl-alcohol dehydrogenase-like predicted oxidoreductase
MLPTRALGKTGVPVTILGVGGEGVLRTWGRHKEAVAVIRRALEHGITYCDTAPAYSGSQDYYGEALGEFRKRIFLASKTHDRTRDGSLRLLEQSLRRLRTDHLDLWQLHDLRSMEELEVIFGRAGAIHALEQARREGLVKYLGITGHYDPAVLVEAIRRYPFDTALVSLNVADRARLSFINELLPTAAEHQLGIIGMKVFARGALLQSDHGFTVSQALGYVLSLSISTAIVGFDSPAEVDQAVEAVQRFQSLSDAQMKQLEARAQPFAAEANWFKRIR